MRENESCPICLSSNLRLVSRAFYSTYLLECNNCSVVFLPLRRNNPELYTLYQPKGWERELIRVRHNRGLHYSRFEKIKEYKSEGSVLDIGCSAGIFMVICKEEGFQVKGIDPLPDRSILYEEIADDVVKGFWETVEFDEKFDVIAIFDTLEHVMNPVFVMKKIHRYLNDGGLCMITVPDAKRELLEHPPETLNMTYEDIARTTCQHMFCFTDEALDFLAKKTGFKVLETDLDIEGTLRDGSVIRKLLEKS